MLYRLWRLLLLSTLAVCVGFPQGLQTTASRDDWEEINFETGSTILSDGYPSLLRLAELLKKNPGYKVKLVGHGDDGGTDRYNQKLAEERARTVKNFLVKYGADPNQISTEGKGRRDPKVAGRSREARFMNRRVEVTVTDPQGRTIGDGSIGEA